MNKLNKYISDDKLFSEHQKTACEQPNEHKLKGKNVLFWDFEIITTTIGAYDSQCIRIMNGNSIVILHQDVWFYGARSVNKKLSTKINTSWVHVHGPNKERVWCFYGRFWDFYDDQRLHFPSLHEYSLNEPIFDESWIFTISPCSEMFGDYIHISMYISSTSSVINLITYYVKWLL